ncbi:hypothetical protein JX265_010520 [Neoarthrinium moseri]|uniref:Alcohol acetyltransferase n=1 Tax=Neoarthrinium moseri TaxID=1658444 RepID=A0A9P9WE10_9PEZI|nr:hypothetical protein JX266_007667 [Neoarthrinium moseri]KAI1859043.1 hypothetical protein JX265_010520 [Neoarthrinium moseri]
MSCFRAGKASDTKKPNVLRRLGSVEGFQSVQHLRGYYYACGVTCRYAIPRASGSDLHLRGSTLRDVFERALALVILHHPFLQAGIANEGSRKPLWVKLNSIDLGKEVQWQRVEPSEKYDEVVCRILEKKHDTRFPDLERRPSWRIIVLESSDLTSLDVLFVWNHAIADGMSGKIFHQTLLEKLNVAPSETGIIDLNEHVLQLPKSLQFTPPLEKLIKFPLSAGFIVSEGWRAFRPPSLVPANPYAASWAPFEVSSNQTRLCLVTIQNAELKNVLQLCRHRETTLTGLLHGLTLASMAKRIPKEKAQAFESGTPIDLRRFMTPSPGVDSEFRPDRTIGNFVTYFSSRFDKTIVEKLRQHFIQSKTDADVDGSFEAIIWSVAKEFRHDISKKLERGPRNDTVGLAKLVTDWRTYMKDEAKKPRAVSWEFSNIGVIDATVASREDASEKQEDWIIDRALFSQSSAALGPAIVFSPIAVKGKDLVICCSWQSKVVEDALVEGVAADLQAWLEDLGTDGQLHVGQRD